LAFRFTFCVVLLQIPAVYLGARIGGIAGVAWTVLVLQLAAEAAAYIFLLRPLIGPCLREYASCIAVPVATSICMAIVVLLVPQLIQGSLPIIVAMQIAVGATFYVAATLSLQRMKLHSVLDGLRPIRS
jgi:lipopolysaccharide exporter